MNDDDGLICHLGEVCHLGRAEELHLLYRRRPLALIILASSWDQVSASQYTCHCSWRPTLSKHDESILSLKFMKNDHFRDAVFKVM